MLRPRSVSTLFSPSRNSPLLPASISRPAAIASVPQFRPLGRSADAIDHRRLRRQAEDNRRLRQIFDAILGKKTRCLYLVSTLCDFIFGYSAPLYIVTTS